MGIKTNFLTMYLNTATIIGNLTRDPELKSLPSGSAVCSFSVATNRTWKDKDGNKQESVEFHNVTAFGRTAELVSQYMCKGSKVLVIGRLQTRSWDKDGQKHYRTEIVAETVQFGSRGKNETGNQQTIPEQRNSAGGDVEYPEEDINPDDIPF